MSAANNLSFGQEFHLGDGDDDDDDEDSLRHAVFAFRSSLRDAPVPTSVAQDVDDLVIPGDMDSENKARLAKMVSNERRRIVQFTPIEFGSEKTWKPGGCANAVLQRSKFSQSRGEPGKSHSLVVMCAELFPTRAAFTDPNAHKAHQQPKASQELLQHAAKWCTTAKNDNTIVLFFDGRDKKTRRVFEDRVTEVVADEQKQAEVSLVYGAPPRGDVRFPKRKTSLSCPNLEIVTVMLPLPKIRMTSKPRDHFSACGESSTHATSYTGATFRRFGTLPRLTLENKEEIVGATLPSYPDEVAAAVKEKGHPLFWNENKEVAIFVAFFEDFNADSIFDVTPGSGAAAIAAAILGIPYEGLAMNSHHVNWLNRIVDKAMYAIIMDSSDEQFKPIKAELSQYFTDVIDEGRVYLTSDQDDEQDDDEVSDEDNGPEN